MAGFHAIQGSKPGLHLASDRCPTCDQPIPNDRLDEVNGRIALKERQFKAELEARFSQALEAEHAKADAAITAMKAELAVRAEAIRTEDGHGQTAPPSLTSSPSWRAWSTLVAG